MRRLTTRIIVEPLVHTLAQQTVRHGPQRARVRGTPLRA